MDNNRDASLGDGRFSATTAFNTIVGRTTDVISSQKNPGSLHPLREAIPTANKCIAANVAPGSNALTLW